MAEKVTLVGQILDPAGRPLNGHVVLDARHEYIVEGNDVGGSGRRIWAGAVKANLDNEGRFSLSVVPDRYLIKFYVVTAQGIPTRISPIPIYLYEDSQLPALLWESATVAEHPGRITKLIVVRKEPGEVVVQNREFTVPSKESNG